MVSILADLPSGERDGVSYIFRGESVSIREIGAFGWMKDDELLMISPASPRSIAFEMRGTSLLSIQEQSLPPTSIEGRL